MRDNLHLDVAGREETRLGRFFRPGRLAGFAAVLAVATGPAYGLIITPTYDSSVDTNFGANATAFKNAFAYAASQIDSQFSDNVHVNIRVDGAAGTSILGQSSTLLLSAGAGSAGYTAIRNAAVADATTADDQTSVGTGGSAPAADPAGGNGKWWIARSEGKALNLVADDTTAGSDGTVTFGAGFTYTYDPNNRAVGGAIDIIGVMMHEISEVMGRIGLSGSSFGGATSYMFFDAFSYQGAGTRGLGGGAGNWFSIDNGATLLKAFNGVGGGDTRDWASGTNDSFNAFSTSGVLNALTAVDLRTMDVIGWDFIQQSQVPEPGTLALFGVGVAALVMRRSKLKQG